MLQTFVHYGFHFIVPLFFAQVFFPKKIRLAYLLMVLTMLVDLDHLIANPIFDPHRCSVGFHPLHSFPMPFLYLLLLLIPKTRIIGLGLVWHMITDTLDCIWMCQKCIDCTLDFVDWRFWWTIGQRLFGC